ncbi:MAG: glycosyltransferase family 2 protein [Acidobacteriota bacterium]
MTTPPLVTIITPSRNHARYVRQTIDSVLAQDYPHLEYWVIDGQSTDETVAILKEYGGQLRWTSAPDRGQAHAINKGLSMAAGDILGWLNSDDTYLPGAISAVVRAFVEHPDVMLIYGEGNLMTESGRILCRFPRTQPFDLWKLANGIDYIQQPSCFFRREAFDAVDGLDERLNWCMDWDLWIKMGSRFRVMYIGDCLSNARVHPASKTSQGGIARIREILTMLKRHNRRLPRRETLGLMAGFMKSITYDRCLRGLRVSPPPDAPLRQRLRTILFDGQGVYDDSTLGRKARFLFPFGMPADRIVLDLERNDREATAALRIRIVANGAVVGEQTVAAPGRFSVSVPYDSSRSRPTEVTLLSDRAFAHGPFWRRRSCVLRGTAWSTAYEPD